MPKDQSIDLQFRGRAAAELDRRRGIMVADDPDPVLPRGEIGQARDIHRRHAVLRGIVMKTIAQADHPFGPMAFDHPGEPF